MNPSKMGLEKPAVVDTWERAIGVAVLVVLVVIDYLLLPMKSWGPDAILGCRYLNKDHFGTYSQHNKHIQD